MECEPIKNMKKESQGFCELFLQDNVL